MAKNLRERLIDHFLAVIILVKHIKSHPLQDGIFELFCEMNSEDFQVLLLHTEVRRLSKGKCPLRFIALWDTIIAFLSGTDY